MNVWLVSPAWGRFEVTRLVLEQRRWLCDELASRGLRANSVIVAGDENLDIAAEYGFPTVEMDNSDLGARFNAGYRHAAEQGADVFVHIGSDDWLHPDAFNAMHDLEFEIVDGPPPIGPDGFVVWRRGPQVLAQRRILMADLVSGTARRCFVESRQGSIPWFIPRAALEPEGFAPIKTPGLMRGIDGAVMRGMRTRPTWVFQDAPDEWCVDWKSDTNLTPYRGVTNALGVGEEEEPWEMLAEFYPPHLIERARSLSNDGAFLQN